MLHRQRLSGNEKRLIDVRCNNCARPIVLNGSPQTPIYWIDDNSVPYCRDCAHDKGRVHKRKIDNQIAELKNILQDLIINHESKVKETNSRIERYGETAGLIGCRKWDEAKAQAFGEALRYVNSLDN